MTRHGKLLSLLEKVSLQRTYSITEHEAVRECSTMQAMWQFIEQLYEQ